LFGSIAPSSAIVVLVAQPDDQLIVVVSSTAKLENEGSFASESDGLLLRKFAREANSRPW